MMNILVACPNNYVTGGIELLHQLCAELNKNRGIDAKMWYIGQDMKDPQPSEYD